VGGLLRRDAARTSAAWRALVGAIAARHGAEVVRLAASGPDTKARYRAIAGIPVEGDPGCTVDLRLEPTTDGVMLGVLERHGGDDAAVEVVLVADRDGADPRTLRLPADQQSLVFYEDHDPGAGARAFAYRLK